MHKHFLKKSDYGASLNVPGVPISAGVSQKDVRIPGMSRFVPRGTFENVYQQYEQGASAPDIIAETRGAGAITHPLIGALLAGALMHKVAPKAGLTTKALGSLLGAGAGSVYNTYTEPKREADALASLKGVLAEQGQISLQNQGHNTAHEGVPVVVKASGSG